MPRSIHGAASAADRGHRARQPAWRVGERRPTPTASAARGTPTRSAVTPTP